jgi:hypothetical protein
MKSEKESSFKVLFSLKIPTDFFSVAVAPLLSSTKDFQISTLDTILFRLCVFLAAEQRTYVLIYLALHMNGVKKDSGFSYLKG